MKHQTRAALRPHAPLTDRELREEVLIQASQNVGLVVKYNPKFKRYVRSERESRSILEDHGNGRITEVTE